MQRTTNARNGGPRRGLLVFAPPHHLEPIGSIPFEPESRAASRFPSADRLPCGNEPKQREPAMSDAAESGGGIRSRGEEAIGDLAQSLLENPLFSQALGKALGAGERAARGPRGALEAHDVASGSAQGAALNGIDVPSASDLERLSRRVRALYDRVEALEDELDRLRRDRGD